MIFNRCNKFFSKTHHRISLIFCIKLAVDKTKKVTKPDFWKKICLQNIGLFASKIEVFGHFLQIASLDFASFAYCIRENDISQP